MVKSKLPHSWDFSLEPPVSVTLIIMPSLLASSVTTFWISFCSSAPGVGGQNMTASAGRYQVLGTNFFLFHLLSLSQSRGLCSGEMPASARSHWFRYPRTPAWMASRRKRAS